MEIIPTMGYEAEYWKPQTLSASPLGVPAKKSNQSKN